MLIKLDNEEIRAVIAKHIQEKFAPILAGKSWRANTYMGESVKWFVSIADTPEQASKEIVQATKVDNGRIVW